MRALLGTCEDVADDPGHRSEQLAQAQPTNLDLEAGERSLFDFNAINGEVRVPPEFLREFCTTRNITMAMVCHAAWAMVLHAFTGFSDVCFSYPTSGRQLVSLYPMQIVGFFPLIGIRLRACQHIVNMWIGNIRVDSRHEQNAILF